MTKNWEIYSLYFLNLENHPGLILQILFTCIIFIWASEISEAFKPESCIVKNKNRHEISMAMAKTWETGEYL